jgi:hypothetical protein
MTAKLTELQKKQGMTHLVIVLDREHHQILRLLAATGRTTNGRVIAELLHGAAVQRGWSSLADDRQ